MKLKVWESVEAASGHSEEQLYLKLIEQGGVIGCVAVDKKGEEIEGGAAIWYIERGIIVRNYFVSDRVPLRKDILDTVLTISLYELGMMNEAMGKEKINRLMFEKYKEHLEEKVSKEPRH